MTRRSRNRSTAGLALVGLGALFLVAQLFGFGFWGLAWPLFVLLPGVSLFYLVRALGKGAAILTVPASVLTTLGILLLYQNTFNHWTSWAYAWSLVLPGSLGLGIAFFGDLTRRPNAARIGEGMAKVGAGLFLAGAVFFELFLNISGLVPGMFAGWFLPLLMIAGGFYLIRRKRRSKRSIYVTPRRPRELSDEQPLDDFSISDLTREREPVRRS
jgi:hypothetical protein